MFELHRVQSLLLAYKLDGWLLYDFRRSNALCCRLLDIPDEQLLSRRFFYWIPLSGNPVKIVSAVENPLTHLVGETVIFHTWHALVGILRTLLTGSHMIAMEYSPQGAIPEISRVDAGTIECIRQMGVDVVSSGDLLQELMCVWNEEQWEFHQRAAHVLDETVEVTWKWLSERLKREQLTTEYEVQQYMLKLIEAAGCIVDHPPICAVNSHSSNPHYFPSRDHSWPIKHGDWILLDLWCRENKPNGVFADITRVGVAANQASNRQQQIFSIVQRAQQAGIECVKQHASSQLPLCGYEVDQVVRRVIEDAGFGQYFVHRTGHNIDKSGHGPGAHLDDLETHDERQLVTGTCFSIEPGIYLPDEFGVRLEYDVFLHPQKGPIITGGVQATIQLLCN